MWGLLPLALELLLRSVDSITLTWVRLLAAALLVSGLLLSGGRLPRLVSLGARGLGLLLIAILALTGNFVLYLLSLERLNPETAQVMIQLAPFLLMAGSVLLYGDSFGRQEALGALLLLSGLLLFFNDRLASIFGAASDYNVGLLLMLLAALSWSVYGLLQKTLLRSLDSRQLTLCIYVGGTLALSPFIELEGFAGLSLPQLGALAFSCLNTVVAYGAFTEAMHYWNGAKVSAVISLAPLVTIGAMQVALRFWPQQFPDSGINALSYFGALLVVGGSMLASLGRSRTKGTVGAEGGESGAER